MPVSCNNVLPYAWVKPIFRWAGSKRKLLDELVDRSPEKYSRYIEPFAGSACLFFALRPQDAVLADCNAELIATYSTIRNHPWLVHRMASGWPVTTKFYYEIRESVTAAPSPITAAARFVYLNRYCFNGVFRTNRSGDFNVPMGTGMGDFPPASSFYRCSIALRHAKLRAQDFAECLQDVRTDDFVYLDPPYAKEKGRFRGEYGYGSFSVADIDRLLECLVSIDRKGAKFLLSYSYCREIGSALKKWDHKSLLVRRHVAGFSQDRARVREALIANYALT
jgi:DNA adenine methylase